MYKYLTKNGQLLAFGLGIVITILFLAIILSGLTEYNALPDESKPSTTIFNLGIYAAIALIVIGFLSMFAFGIFQVAGNLKGSIKGIAGVVGLVVIFFIARTIGSDDSSISATLSEFQITDGQSSLITGAIMTALVMAGLAAVAFIYSEVRNFFK